MSTELTCVTVGVTFVFAFVSDSCTQAQRLYASGMVTPADMIRFNAYQRRTVSSVCSVCLCAVA